MRLVVLKAHDSNLSNGYGHSSSYAFTESASDRIVSAIVDFIE